MFSMRKLMTQRLSSGGQRGSFHGEGEALFFSSLSFPGIIEGPDSGEEKTSLPGYVSGPERGLICDPDPTRTGSRKGMYWLEIKLPHPFRKARRGMGGKAHLKRNLKRLPRALPTPVIQ